MIDFRPAHHLAAVAHAEGEGVFAAKKALNSLRVFSVEEDALGPTLAGARARRRS